LSLKLTDLMTIKTLHVRKALSMAELSKLTQRSEAYMQDVLGDLQRRRLVSYSQGRFALADEAASHSLPGTTIPVS